MLASFKHNIEELQGKILLAVSGGIDSIVMVDLFAKSGLDFSIAHCNFQLRGVDSDGDQLLVESLAEKYQIKVYTKQFDTKCYSRENGVSIQMAARDLRYQWFDEVIRENSYEWLATAHHKNDVAESMLINLVNGTGIAGLHGILNRDNVLRPLIDFSKDEIISYAVENNLTYREDASNKDDKYTRNFIRNKIIPGLETINPKVVDAINKAANHLEDVELIFLNKVEEERQKCSKLTNEKLIISIEGLNKLNPVKTFLYYFIKDYGFTGSDVNNIISNLKSQSGKVFYSRTHQLLKDRKELIISIKNIKEEDFVEIYDLQDFSKLNISFEKIIPSNNYEFSQNQNKAYLDFDKISFPLKVRNWKEGDTFKPLGLKGSKKLSDFFIDQKIPLFEKQRVKILDGRDGIIWVVGHRIDDKYKVTPSTQTILKLESN